MKSPPTEQITFIYVKDLNRSRAFYEELMEFELVLDQGRLITRFCAISLTTSLKVTGLSDPVSQA